ncbi:glycosyltransferase [Candidatus Sororendozoicomonas aggregata]|uniref:glycosyltransferase n=1 Tax=Candidatus Sororendozoicomonas aggregata TaxID=3073239 RepID=UPI002ED35885
MDQHSASNSGPGTALLPVALKSDSHSVYLCRINISNTAQYTALKLIGQDIQKTVFVNRDIKKDGEISTVFFTYENPAEIFFELKSNGGKGIKPELLVDAFDIEKVGSTLKPVALTTNDTTISAAIATYPARKTALLECIRSLVSQVDYLFIYLNEYQDVPVEIKNHPLKNKIICIVDEEGGRRAEGKFHWMKRVNGYYLTCDDDIVYPPDYVTKTINAIEARQRQCVVGYHGIVFKDAVASFKADRKAFYKFTEILTTDQPCHLLGTGVSGFHTQLFKGVNTQLLGEYPFAVDPAFAVICKAKKIPQRCLAHEGDWLKSSPHMLYGLHEEKQILKDKKRAVDRLLLDNNPWGKGILTNIVAIMKRNPKIRKLINSPKQFFKDAQLLGFYR